jgi:hypothetical protein
MGKAMKPHIAHHPGRRRAIRLLSAAAGVGLLYPMAIRWGGAQSLIQPPAKPVPREYFGMHIHRADAGTAWPTVPLGSWRLWDASVAWPNLEPEKGQWKFAKLDKYVAMAALTKVEILLPLGLSPPWASARPSEPSSYKPGYAAEPRDMEDWRNYVRTVAKRYKGRIRHYEVWNEINLKGFFTGSVQQMVELARIAYETLKEVDPGIVVVSPSVTGEVRQTEWLDKFLGMGGGRYADVIGHHFYIPRSEPEAMLPVIAKVKSIMGKHNLAHKPLWNTESGWWIENKDTSQRLGAAGADWRKLGEQESAAYVARALILGWTAGVSRFYWYAWDNFDMGLIEPSDKSIKLSGRVYGQTARWMEGAVFTGCTESDGLWICELTDKGGRLARMVWQQADQPMEWKIPLSWGATRVEHANGITLKLSPGATTILLERSPVLIG